ncbi:uncharacterized protein TNCT_430451 [Trichonephila clavata]|uniref:Mos1 transposase HTH domain-containing protein n=1 Tax=Trichonephila clavata TaxID=2740835 RepID=A0A8X6HGE4_TRICU|nr:uncharacterized protein TNCT_430451 [Trichonephila clavata]
MECHSEFVEALGNNALPYRIVAWWVGKFQQGRVSTSDEQRTERPLNVRIDLARAVIEQLMDEYRRSRQQTKTDLETHNKHIVMSKYVYFVVILLHREGYMALYTSVIN